MRVLSTDKHLSDLLYTAEQLHADLLEAEQFIEASAAHEVVTGLRVKVREETDGN